MSGGAGRARAFALRVLLRTYPRRFRERFGDELIADYERLLATHGWLSVGRDLLRSIPRERAGQIGAPSGPLSVLRGLPGEFRSAWRGVRSSPALAIVVVFTLALGIGPTTAVYSLANWLLLRPVPGVADADRLGMLMFGEAIEGGLSAEAITYANLAEIAAGLDNLEDLGGTQVGNLAVVFAQGEPESFDAEFVTPSYFTVLGMVPRAGRLLTAADDDPVQGGAPVAVVSRRFAHARFGSVEAAVGAELTINRHPFEVIGVLPAGFHGPADLGRTDLWLPGTTQFRVNHLPEATAPTNRAHGVGYYEFVARIAPGSTWERAIAELEARMAALAERYPEDTQGWAKATFQAYPGIGYLPLARATLARTLWLLGAVVSCVLLVACANVSNLLFVRAIEQRGQIAVQKALGASAARIARHGLFEGLILCACGALLGVALGAAMLEAFEGTRLTGMVQTEEGVQLDGRVAEFVALLCLGVTLVASLLPSLRAARVDPAAWLARSSLTSTDGGWRWRGALSILQVSVGVPLVLGAALFAATLAALARTELGYEPGTVGVLWVHPSTQGYDAARSLLYKRDLLAALQAEPAITHAALSGTAPYAHCCRRTRLALAGSGLPPLEPLEVSATAGYFDMLGIPVLRGRSFGEDEVLAEVDQGSDIVVLSESLARRLFDEGPAVGRTVEFPVRGRHGRLYRVVGVVADVRYDSLVAPTLDVAYTPLGAHSFLTIVLVDGPDPAAARAAAIAAGRRIDPLLPVVPYRPAGLADGVEAELSERTLLVRLFVTLAAIAALLAAAGVYGTSGRMVSSRRREIGLRMALGADRKHVVRTVTRGSVIVALAGTLAGAALAAFGTRLIESRLYGVSALDPLAWAMALLAPLLVVLLAALPSARRAARTDPAAALRG